MNKILGNVPISPLFTIAKIYRIGVSHLYISLYMVVQQILRLTLTSRNTASKVVGKKIILTCSGSYLIRRITKNCLLTPVLMASKYNFVIICKNTPSRSVRLWTSRFNNIKVIRRGCSLCPSIIGSHIRQLEECFQTQFPGKPNVTG